MREPNFFIESLDSAIPSAPLRLFLSREQDNICPSLGVWLVWRGKPLFTAELLILADFLVDDFYKLSD
jgi:hypothetical protein